MRSSSHLALGALRHGRVLQVLRARFWASTKDTEGPGDHQGGLALRRVSQGLKRPHSSHLSLLTSHPSRVFLTVFPTCPDLGSSSSWLRVPRFVHLGLRRLAAGGHVVRSGGKKGRKGRKGDREGGASPVVSASPLNPRCYLSKMQHPQSRLGVRPHHCVPTHSLPTRI